MTRPTPGSRLSVRRVATVQPKSHHDAETNLIQREAIAPLDTDDELPTQAVAPSNKAPAFPQPAAEVETRIARRRVRREPIENSDDFRENSIRARRLESRADEPQAFERSTGTTRTTGEGRLSYHPRSSHEERASFEPRPAFEPATGRTGRTQNERFAAPAADPGDRYLKADRYVQGDRYLKSQDEFVGTSRPRTSRSTPVQTLQTRPLRTPISSGAPQTPSSSQPITAGRREVSVNAPWTFPTDAGAVHTGRTAATKLASLSSLKVNIIYGVMIASVAVLIASAISFHSSLRDQAAVSAPSSTHVAAGVAQAQALPPAANRAPTQAPTIVQPAAPAEVANVAIVPTPLSAFAPPPAPPQRQATAAVAPRFAPTSTPPAPRWTAPKPVAVKKPGADSNATNLEQIMSDGLSGR